MNGRFRMQGSKNWILPKQINANRFFWDSHWLEIWSNRLCPSMGPNGGRVAMDSEATKVIVSDYRVRVCSEGCIDPSSPYLLSPYFMSPII
jgi:hypothetical protein